jgi:hypothetical protein
MMAQMNQLGQLASFALGTAIALTAVAPVALASSTPSNQSDRASLLLAQIPQPPSPGRPTGSPRGGATWFTPPVPPSTGLPSGSQRGGASRGDCPNVSPHLTALVPLVKTANSTGNGLVWGQTTVAQPTFWFYIPYALNSDHPAEFVLLDEQNKYVYQTPLFSDETSMSHSGIIRVKLPETVALEPGQIYQWVFMLNCEVDNPIFTRGAIQRVAATPELTAQLAQASTPEAKARVYAANGIWFDALNLLAEQKINKPEDDAIATAWNSLLQSVELSDIADKPLIP